MMKTTPLVFSLLLVLILSLATSAEEFEKRTSCSVSKRDVLKRNNVKKCPCAVAQSSFTGRGGFTGFWAFAQNECGEVKTFGQFYGGFEKKRNYTFQIVDDCGNTINDLGNLNIVVNDDGSTGPFSETFDTFNLNCDKNGILFTKSAVYKKKRNCHPSSSHKKRAPGDGGSYAQISGGSQGSASETISIP